MKREYTVYMRTDASASIRVEVDEAEVRAKAHLDDDEPMDEYLREAAIAKAYNTVPTLCAQCSGWGRSYGLELGDDWEVDDDSDAVVEAAD